MAHGFTIAVGGENLIDLVEVSRSNEIPQYLANPGGSPFNMAIAASRQGNDVVYLSPLSNDRLGKLLTQRLTESGVILKAPILNAPTSLAVVSVDDGQPSYQFYRKDTAERKIDAEIIEKAFEDTPWAFHVGSLAISGGKDADLWHDTFISCYQKGIMTSLDPNVRPALIEDRASYMQRIEKMFQYADIIKLSDEDISWLYPEMELDEAFEHLINISCAGLRVLTKGVDGADARSISAKVKIPSHPVENLIETVGAGDTFMASMLTWLSDHGKSSRHDLQSLSAKDLNSMIDWAATAASLNCEQRGCNPPFRDAIAALQ